MTGEQVRTAGEYTPTTDEVREAWRDEMFPNASDAAFDRWLTQVRADAYAQGVREVLDGHRCDDQAERAYRRATRAEDAARAAYAQGGRDALTAAADLIDEVIDEHGIAMRDGSRGCYDDDHEDRVTYSVVGEEELRKVEGSLRARAAQIGADQ